MASLAHILVATDGSDPAQRAVALAAMIADALRARLTIIAVEVEPSSRVARGLARAEGDLGAVIDAGAEQILTTAAASAQALGVSDISTVTAWGDPTEAILELLGHDPTDLLVLGRRGRGRLAGLLLGSVSQKLVSLAPCAITVVP